MLKLLVLAALAACVAAKCEHCMQPCDIEISSTVSGVTSLLNYSSVTCPDAFGSAWVDKRGAWYTFTGNGETMMASLCDDDTDYDTMIVVLAGHCSTVCIAYDDDGCGGDGHRSTVTFPTTVGITYFIFVTGFSTETGFYVLSLVPVETPHNSICKNATKIANPLSFAAYEDTTMAEVSPRHCAGNITGYGLWYDITGPGKWLVAKTCDENTAIDTVIDVYISGCDTDGSGVTCLTYNDDSCGIASEVLWFAAPTLKYLLFVGGYGTARGRFMLEINQVDPNFNSRCTSALEIDELPYEHKSNTTNCLDTLSTCSGATRRGQFYRIHGMGKMLDAYTCSFDNVDLFDNVVEVFTSCYDNTSIGGCVDWNDDYCGRNARVRWFAKEGQEYYIWVAGFSASTAGGNYTLTVTEAHNDSNTACWTSKQIESLPWSYSTSTADIDVSSVGCSGQMQEETRWFSYYHDQDDPAPIKIDTCNRETVVKTEIEVYTACGSKTCVMNEYKCGDGKAWANFTATPRMWYHIAVYTPSKLGYVHLEVEHQGAAPNSVCSDAIDIITMPTSVVGYTSGAQGVRSTCTNTTQHGQWYRFVGNGKKMVASTCPDETDFDTAIDIYRECSSTAGCYAYDSEDPLCGDRARVRFPSARGATYYVYVHGDNSESGIYRMQLYDEEDPHNSKCSTATTIHTLPYLGAGVTTYAVPSNGSCRVAVPQFKGTWWVIQGTDHYLTVSTCFDETDFDTLIEVYTECIHDAGRFCYAMSSDSYCGRKDMLTFAAYRNNHYYIAITSPYHAIIRNGYVQMSVTEGAPIYPGGGSSGLSPGAAAAVSIVVIAVVGVPAGFAGWWYLKKRSIRADYNVIS